MTSRVSNALLHAGNGLFHALHLSIISFSALGWLIPPLRGYHLALQGLILCSWFGLGVSKGWGYCVVTDMQWRLRARSGIPTHTDSYVKWLIDKGLKVDIAPQKANLITFSIFALTTLASIALWIWF